MPMMKYEGPFFLSAGRDCHCCNDCVAYEANFGGATIRVTVRARQSKTTPSSSMELGYFTTGVGDSGWKPFSLSGEFVDYSFEFSPNPPIEKGIDYVGIWPDPAGKGGVIDVQSVRVERLRP